MMEEFEMKILVLNCGSSSLKYQLIDMENEQVLTKGLCERIGIDGSVLTHKVPGKDNYVVETPMPDHSVAVQLVLDALTSAEHGVIKSVDEINAIGHRVLHGGTKFTKSIVVNEDVKAAIRECFDLGPLHNPANLMGIEACEKVCPGKPNVAVFDTTFGMGMDEKSYLYAATASTAPATALSPKRRSNSAAWIRRMQKLSFATSATALPFPLRSAANASTPRWA